MSVIETVKEHPLIIGGVVLGAIVLVVIIGSSGGSSTGTSVATVDPSQTAAATALQSQQLQAQSDANTIQGQLQALQIQGATAIAGANIAAQTTDNANYLQYKGQSEATQAKLTTDTLNSTLASNVAITQSQNDLTAQLASYTTQTNLATIQANQNIATQQILENAVESANNATVQIANVNAFASTVNSNNFVQGQIQTAQIASNTAVQTAQITANAQIAQSQYAASVAAQQSNAALQASLSHDEHSGGLFGGGGFLGLGF